MRKRSRNWNASLLLGDERQRPLRSAHPISAGVDRPPLDRSQLGPGTEALPALPIFDVRRIAAAKRAALRGQSRPVIGRGWPELETVSSLPPAA